MYVYHFKKYDEEEPNGRKPIGVIKLPIFFRYSKGSGHAKYDAKNSHTNKHKLGGGNK